MLNSHDKAKISELIRMELSYRIKRHLNENTLTLLEFQMQTKTLSITVIDKALKARPISEANILFLCNAIHIPFELLLCPPIVDQSFKELVAMMHPVLDNPVQTYSNAENAIPMLKKNYADYEIERNIKWCKFLVSDPRDTLIREALLYYTEFIRKSKKQNPPTISAIAALTEQIKQKETYEDIVRELEQEKLLDD